MSMSHTDYSYESYGIPYRIVDVWIVWVCWVRDLLLFKISSVERVVDVVWWYDHMRLKQPTVPYTYI